MNLEPGLNEDDTSGLEAYLLPPSMGSYSEKDLANAFAGLQAKLKSLNLPQCGDIYRNDVENVKSTVKW